MQKNAPYRNTECNENAISITRTRCYCLRGLVSLFCNLIPLAILIENSRSSNPLLAKHVFANVQTQPMIALELRFLEELLGRRLVRETGVRSQVGVQVGGFFALERRFDIHESSGPSLRIMDLTQRVMLG